MTMMMMTKTDLTTKNQDKLGESFSFPYNDFSSSALGIYSSDDGEDDDNCSEAESYIEIQVQQPKHRSSLYRGSTATKDFFASERDYYPEADDDDDHIELRISISSAVPLPQISHQCFNDAIKAIESRIGFSEEKPIEESSTLVLRKGAKWGNIQFPSVKRAFGVLGVLFSNLKVTPEICHAQEKDVFNVISNRNNKKLELLRPSNTIRTPQTTERGITKFLIKIKAMQIRPFLSSVLKNCQVVGSRPKLGNNSKAKNRAIDDTVQCYRRVPSKVSRQSSVGKSHKDQDSVMKGCTFSCPSSISSSPINRTYSNSDGKGYAAENSVQEAIAHCKRSFSPFPGFSFPPYL